MKACSVPVARDTRKGRSDELNEAHPLTGGAGGVCVEFFSNVSVSLDPLMR